MGKKEEKERTGMIEGKDKNAGLDGEYGRSVLGNLRGLPALRFVLVTLVWLAYQDFGFFFFFPDYFLFEYFTVYYLQFYLILYNLLLKCHFLSVSIFLPSEAPVFYSVLRP